LLRGIVEEEVVLVVGAAAFRAACPECGAQALVVAGARQTKLQFHLIHRQTTCPWR
jgi:hypothetical protein